jgi:hypothetical protein
VKLSEQLNEALSQFRFASSAGNADRVTQIGAAAGRR